MLDDFSEDEQIDIRSESDLEGMRLQIAEVPHVRALECNNADYTIETFILRLSKPDDRSHTKDGPGFLQGRHEPSVRRTNNAMLDIRIIAFDVDTGQDSEEIIRRAGELGLYVAIYPTFNDGATTSSAQTDKVHQWVNRVSKDRGWTRLEAHEEASEAQILAYFAEHAADAVRESLHEPRRVGFDYAVSHAPLRKYRVVLILNRAVGLVELGATREAVKAKWKAMRRALADLLCITEDDRACDDLARIFYYPRRREAHDDWWFNDNEEGHAVDIDKLIALVDAQSVSNSRAEKRAASPQTGSTETSAARAAFNHFWTRHGVDFDIEQLIADHADGVEKEGQDKVEGMCPNREGGDLGDGRTSMGHSDETLDNPTLVGWNREHSKRDRAIASCNHQTCQKDLKTGDYVWLLMQEAGLSLQELRAYVGATDAELPKPFVREEGRIYAQATKKQGEEWVTETHAVCTDFRLEARARDPSGTGWARMIRFKTEDGYEKRVFISDKDLAADGRKLREGLADEGFWIATGSKERQLFQKLLSDLRSNKIATRCAKPGWYASGDAKVFVAPNGEVFGDVVGADVFLLETTNQTGFKPKGDEVKWRDGLTRCLRPETPHWALGVCVGVAGAIVDLLEEPSFGINFYGSSSTGKTTAQKIAAGMWGSPEPDQGLLYTCRSTDNAMEFLLERGNGTSIHLDEAKTGKSKELADLAFFISGGVGKKRMRADASERESKNWRTVATISSEKPMSSIVSDANTAEVSGLHVRMPAIDVSGITPLLAAEAADIRQLLLQNYGFGGSRFVSALIDLGYLKDARGLRERIDQRQAELLKTTKLPTVERAARQFAILWVCGDIMREARIVEMETDKFGVAVKWAWETWLNGDDARKLAPVSDSVDTLITFIQNNPHRVADCKFANNSNQEVLAYYDEEMIYLPVASLNKIPGLQSSPSAILKGLDERGMLIRQGKNMPHQHIPGVGAGRPHYRIKFRLYEKKDVMAQACEWMQRSPNDSVGQLQRDG